MQLRMGTWLCCSGCVPMAARGMGGCVNEHLSMATRLCCTGLAPMDAQRLRLTVTRTALTRAALTSE
jgi:hypothetical protein